MSLVLEKEQKSAFGKQIGQTSVLHVDEAVALCPNCKAFQTVCFVGDKLLQTRKFSQQGSQIYHDCGSDEPCRLYRGI